MRASRLWRVACRLAAVAFCLCCLHTVYTFSQPEWAHGWANDPRVSLIVFTATFYPKLDDVRVSVAIDTLTALTKRSIPVVVVDDSPDPQIRQLLQTTGASVFRQQSKGGKGSALREAAVLAAQVDSVHTNTWLCWQEPEKTDMARLWKQTLLSAADAGVAIPAREPISFEQTYPIEQYHSEVHRQPYTVSRRESNLTQC